VYFVVIYYFSSLDTQAHAFVLRKIERMKKWQKGREGVAGSVGASVGVSETTLFT